MIVPSYLKTKDISSAKPKAFIKNGCLYSRINRVEAVRYTGPVYDMNIENVHAYRSAIGLYHNSDVDMDDIRVRYVDDLGRELHDYSLWESQLKKSMQQPFLEGSTEPVHMGGGVNMMGLPKPGYGGARGQWNVFPTTGMMSDVQINVYDNREIEISDAVRKYIGG